MSQYRKQAAGLCLVGNTITEKQNNHTGSASDYRRMTLLPKSRSRESVMIAFVRSVCNMVERGDIDLIGESLRGYWVDKKAHPWHRVLKYLQRKGDKYADQKQLAEWVGVLRDGVFAALDALSLNLAVDISIEEILSTLLSAETWRDGRREVRNVLAKVALDLIDRHKLDHLQPSELARDGFGFLVPRLLDSQIRQLEKCRPVEKDDTIDLTALHRSVLGRMVLRSAEVGERKLRRDDPRVSELFAAYDRMLLDKEVEKGTLATKLDELTAQATLNGQVVEEARAISAPEPAVGVGVEENGRTQKPLTEFIDEKQPSAREKKTKKSATKGPKRKKKSGGSKKR